MKLTPEQRKLAKTILQVGRKEGASPREIKSAIETGIVESNLTNLPGGDGTSVGWRQEIDTYGSKAKRMDVAGAAHRYFREAKGFNNRGGSAGQLAQRTQRSAYPDRYDQHSGEAEQILKALSGSASSDSSSSPSSSGGEKSVTTSTPGVDRSADRRALVAQFITGKNPKALVETMLAVNQTADTPGTSSTETVSTPATSSRTEPVASASGRAVVDKTDIVRLGKLAQRMGLHVGENSHFNGGRKVTGGHAPNSNHYTDSAIDVSGDPAKMKQFATHVDRIYGGKLDELFWNGDGAVNRKGGKRVQKGFVSGHTDHVHAAVKK